MNYKTLLIRKEKIAQTAVFLNLMNMQMHVKINRRVAFFIEYSGTKKSKYCCHPPFHPPNLCLHSLKLLSSTLPKLMNCQVGLSLSKYRWKALPEQNINVQNYFNNTLLSLNPKRMQNMHFCLKRPAFFKFS